MSPASGRPISRPRSDVTLTLDCNNSCVFCPRKTLAHVAVARPEDVLPRLRSIRASSRRVVLTGGEVTLLPDAPGTVAACRALGFQEIAIVTNGRMLGEGDLAERLVAAGLTEVSVTMYDLRPDVHDGLTGRPGSLAETMRGLGKVLALAGRSSRPSVRVNTILCGPNQDGLLGLLRELHSLGVRDVLVADMVLSEAWGRPVPNARKRSLARAVAADPELARLYTTWRGFPLCVMDGIPGVRVEPHDVDTTQVEGDIDPYFSAFYGNFELAGSCLRCAAPPTCPGVQRLHLDALGEDGISALPDRTTPALVRKDLEGFHSWPDPARLAVTPTTACQLRCRYCNVKLGSRRSPPEVLDRAVDLLIASRRERAELQFFGGEPLLARGEVVRTMERGSRLAAATGKRLHFTLTTNGILLDRAMIEVLGSHDASVIFSLDGPPGVMAAQRPARKGRAGQSAAAHSRIVENLGALARSRVPFFVNMVIEPCDAAFMAARVEHAASLGVRTVQICYSLGPGWDAHAREAFVRGLHACASLVRELASRGIPLRVQNLGSAAEPTVLGNDLIVDVDGTLYGDGALFGERSFPGLRPSYRIGDIRGIASIDGLRRTREENLAIMRRTFPAGSPARRIVEEQLELGRAVQAAIDEIGDPARQARGRVRDRNPLLDVVLKRTVAEQSEVMRRHPEVLGLPLLLLENACCHDCIFCRAKPLDPTPLAGILDWLRGNDDVRHSRLGLVGNEPLLHPDIDRIVAAARDHGFTRIEALTAGPPLEDEARAMRLIEAGVRGFAIPLHSDDPATHDLITGSPGSHEATMRGIRNAMSLGADVHLHANLLVQNLDGLGSLERMVERDLGLRFCVIPVRPKDANLPYSMLAPSYSDVVARAGVHSLVALPLCVAARIQDPAVPDQSIISDLLKVYVLDQPFIKPRICGSCARRGRCAGTFQAYLDLHGDRELAPFQG